MAIWGATQAKAHFSEVLDKAEAEGPQLVHRRAKRYVLVTEEQWQKKSAEITATAKDTRTLWERLRCPPEDGDPEFVIPRGGKARWIDF